MKPLVVLFAACAFVACGAPEKKSPNSDLTVAEQPPPAPGSQQPGDQQPPSDQPPPPPTEVSFDTVVCTKPVTSDTCEAPLQNAQVTVTLEPSSAAPQTQASNGDGYILWTVSALVEQVRVQVAADGFEPFDSGDVAITTLLDHHNFFTLQPKQVQVPPGADAIDLSTAIVHNSPADVAQWPATAQLKTLDLQANGVFIDFTKRDGADSWPDVPFGAPGDSLEYTLWIVINIDGVWHTSGCIEYWRGLERNGGPPSEYAMNWYYDSIRWGAMVGHQPAPGEQVGFFVTAGDARNNGNALVKERSNVVLVPFPTDAGAVFTY